MHSIGMLACSQACHAACSLQLDNKQARSVSVAILLPHTTRHALKRARFAPRAVRALRQAQQRAVGAARRTHERAVGDQLPQRARDCARHAQALRAQRGVQLGRQQRPQPGRVLRHRRLADPCWRSPVIIVTDEMHMAA